MDTDSTRRQMLEMIKQGLMPNRLLIQQGRGVNVALSALSLMNYGLEITALNQNLDFKALSGGPVLTAAIPLGFYFPISLSEAIAIALLNADPVNNYSSSVSYSYLGGSENRLTISTTGTYLSLLFATGPNTFTSVVGLIGFNEVDYVGSTAYVGSQTTGTVLIPSQIGYNYLDDQNTLKVFGAVNVSASGLKETVTFNFQEFIQS